jgi:hypothetical protein
LPFDPSGPFQPESFAFINYPGAPRAAANCIIGLRNGDLWECSVLGSSFELRVDRKFLGHSAAITSISVSRDRKLLATSSLDGTIRVWRLTPPRVLGDLGCISDGTRVELSTSPELLKGDVIQRFNEFTYFERIKPIYAGKFAPGDPIQLRVQRSNRTDQSAPDAFDIARTTALSIDVTLQPAPDLSEPLLNIFMSADGEWVAWDRHGFYNSSSEGARHIGFHRNKERQLPADFYTVDQFPGSFYHPNLLVETLRNGRETPGRAVPAFAVTSLEAARIGGAAQFSLDDILPPEVRIVSPSQDAVLSDGSCHVEFEVRVPTNRRIKGAFLKVDQRVVAHPKEDRRRSDNGFDIMSYEADVKLNAGRHTLLAVASHDQAKAESLRVRVVSQGQAENESGKPNLYVLAIGVATYTNESLKLRFADRDATDFVEAVNQNKGGYFGAIESKSLINQEATKEAVLDGLKWLARSCVRQEDVAVVFVSGHGLVDSQDQEEAWFLAPYDINPTNLVDTGISSGTFDNFLEKIPQVIMCVDACRLPSAVSVDGAKAFGAKASNPFRGANEAVFFACATRMASSDDFDSQHGVFAKAILEVLNSPRSHLNDDRQLSFAEFQSAVTSLVTDWTSSNQIPVAENWKRLSKTIIASY